MSAGRLSRFWQKNGAGYMFLLPWLIGFFALTLGPTLASLYLSFTENLDRNVQTFNTSPGNTDFGASQKESDFSFILGWRYSL